MEKWAFLIGGGVAGTLARYSLAGLVYARWGTGFPYGTLVVNLLGCFLIGWLDALCERKFLLSPNLRLLLMTGFCGAFTTFSTWMLETSNLLKGGETLAALGNILVSVLAGFMLFRAGGMLGEWM